MKDVRILFAAKILSVSPKRLYGVKPDCRGVRIGYLVEVNGKALLGGR